MDLTSNRLGDETSPYLLQHRDNPVHWQAWSPATLAAAKAQDKPILLSIGYAACHWCHVMAHESFETPAIAALMNEGFVNIKVDREERPDLDAIYQYALAMLGEQGGWPLTMFLTPDGEPFWGGTYFPPTARYGRPGFPDVLRALGNAYRNDREKVARNAAALKEALGRMSQPQRGEGISIPVTDQIAERLVREVDPFNGGIGDAPKFPQPAIFELLWRGWKRSRKAPFHDAVIRTLDAMCQGGIYDHLGGGFARYSTDARWLAPHFEKMLYDNAELIDLLTLVWQETRSPLYAQRVAETVDWVKREMVTEEGGFASSLDADSEHEEGKFYVWSEAEIDALLGPRAALFKQHYDVTPYGNWEGRTILNRLRSPAPLDAETEAELAACRAVLFHAREERIHPGLDDKVLADWNGLMIAALAHAAQVFERPDWLDLASDAFAFITTQMMDEAGRLSHSSRAGRRNHPAIIDDYANLSRAALSLYEATGETSYLARVERWVDIVDRHYWDAIGEGYFLAADDTDGLITRSKTANDAAVPAGNGTFVAVLARLFSLTGKPAYRDRADAIVATFSGEVGRNFFPLATLINANELLQRAVQIVIRGERDAADTSALLRAVHEVSLPTRILTIIGDDASLPPGHPASGKDAVGGVATAYVCEGPVCSLPITDPAALAVDLQQR
ncbi:MAG: thioredoxin domain-containing protein [Alphaproteobacteria bacterium]|nr:thioredoxin domain-containing protein [Alphaproteobacteria bacterium]